MAVYSDLRNNFNDAEPLNLNIDDFSEGESKDKILEFSIKYLGEHITSSTISEKIFSKEDKEEVKYLMNQMQYEISEYAEFRENESNIFITANKLTEKFFSNRGFAKIEKEHIEIKEKSEQKENLEEQIRKLTRDNLRLGNWDIRFRWYIAAGSFIVGIIVKYFIDK